MLIKSNLPDNFPKFQIIGVILENFHNPSSAAFVDEQTNRIYDFITKKYDTETLKDNPVIQAYRQFYWKYAKVDPTKIRPAGEALMRRLIKSKNIPRILPIVDAYNLASAETAIPMCAYDVDSLVGQLEVRLAEEGEQFFGIGMKEPQTLSPEIPVIADIQGAVSIYPYRDSDRSKIMKTSTRVLIAANGVPGISEAKLVSALELSTQLVTEYCGGDITGKVIFNR